MTDDDDSTEGQTPDTNPGDGGDDDDFLGSFDIDDLDDEDFDGLTFDNLDDIDDADDLTPVDDVPDNLPSERDSSNFEGSFDPFGDIEDFDEGEGAESLGFDLDEDSEVDRGERDDEVVDHSGSRFSPVVVLDWIKGNKKTVIAAVVIVIALFFLLRMCGGDDSDSGGEQAPAATEEESSGGGGYPKYRPIPPADSPIEGMRESADEDEEATDGTSQEPETSEEEQP